jgi:hypothetical protein
MAGTHAFLALRGRERREREGKEGRERRRRSQNKWGL